MPSSFLKDPGEVLDYAFDFAAGPPGPWLEDGDTIAAHNVVVPAGITLDRDEADDTAVTVWLSGGTAHRQYRVVCHVTTTAGRQVKRSIAINVREQ